MPLYLEALGAARRVLCQAARALELSVEVLRSEGPFQHQREGAPAAVTPGRLGQCRPCLDESIRLPRGAAPTHIQVVPRYDNWLQTESGKTRIATFRRDFG